MRRTIVALAMGLPLVAAALTPQPPSIIGEAFDRESEQLLYRELHYFSDDGLDHRVTYQSPTGQRLAEKQVDYRSGFLTPSFYQRDLQDGASIAVDYRGEQLVMRYLERAGESKVEAEVQVSGPLVIDAGFNHFIRERWQSLLQGQALRFEFPAPTRGTLVELQIARRPCELPRQPELESRICFEISSANWLWHWLLDPIELVYDTSSRQLLRYMGVANVSDRGVDIRYRYRPELAEDRQ